MFTSVRHLVALVGREHRGRWLAVLLLALAASGLEVLSAMLVFALLARITSEVSGFEFPVIGDLRELLPVDEMTLLLVVGGIVAGFFVLRGAVILLQAYVQYRVAENAGARLATRLLAGYLAMPATFHLARNSSELIRNAFDTVQQFVREALLPLVKLVSHAILIVGLLAVLLLTAPAATFFAVAVLGPLTWLLLRIVHPRVKRMGNVSQAMSRRTLQTLQEGLAGWRDITVLGRQRAFVERFRVDRRELSRVRYLRSTAKEIPRVAIETGLILFIFAFLGVAVIVGDGALEALPVLGLFGYVALRLQPSLNEVLHAANSLKFAAAGIEHLHADLASFDPDRSLPEPAAATRPLTDELRLVGVAARYPDTHEDVLSDVDVTIRAGEYVGIVGPTGSGKSTLVDLLLGLLEPSAGQILLDGRPLSADVAGWQATVGAVHQNVFLVDASLRRNIALGVPVAEIDEERVLEAVRLAQLDRFVASLPEGLDTVIGEDGVRVSGGQRQRLAVARALYRRPSTIVFDEGTSALDRGTESQLMQALEQLRGQRTIIAVAHRLSTVQHCDKVILVDAGRVVDVAPLDVLAARHGELLGAP
ncbi:ABC transporter ATP-binding protein [Egicoccus halophilus]|uniref:ABC transporter ATP-binding protein n=1 Tax=Egicoccus halophilus TaxID=1670830 RepID=UPI001030BE7B|nr:ABC transporter ATP-binding protein [Egicoccus halophilus]